MASMIPSNVLASVLRSLLGKSQEEIASEAEVSRRTLYRLEAGEVVSHEARQAILRALTRAIERAS